jgi:hypothetical protein
MFLENTSNNPDFSTIEEEDDEQMMDPNIDPKDKARQKLTGIENLSKVSKTERQRILRDNFSKFDIYLAQRDFEKTVELLLKIVKQSQSLDTAQQLVYRQKQTELIQTLRKDLVQAKERGNSKGVVKTGKRVVNSLIKVSI